MVAPGSAAWILGFHQQPEMLERACHRTDRLGGDAGIERSGIEFGVSEQHLDDPDVDILLEQVRGEAVAQCVQADTLLDASGFRCLMNRAVYLARRNWFERGFRPGNNQPWGSMTPRRLPSRHRSRSRDNSCGDSMALRSLRPLPCSTRISMRVLSTSPTPAFAVAGS